MASDQQVDSKAILDAVLELRRKGAGPVLEHLEQVEPELSNYLMETLSLIHQELLSLGAPARKARLIQRQIEKLALVCVMSLRNSHYTLWHGSFMNARLQELDQSKSPGVDGPPPDQSGE